MQLLRSLESSSKKDRLETSSLHLLGKRQETVLTVASAPDKVFEDLHNFSICHTHPFEALRAMEQHVTTSVDTEYGLGKLRSSQSVRTHLIECASSADSSLLRAAQSALRFPRRILSQCAPSGRMAYPTCGRTTTTAGAPHRNSHRNAKRR
ncbi:MAG: hypothetical protein RET84_17695 [Pseudomonadota bacterium]|nr:hypothetical protein [Pseudomonadota bacterium]